MNKSGIKELSISLANKRNLDSEVVTTFVENFFGILSESLRNEKVVKIKGLGTFKIITVSARKSVDVNTGEAIEITSRDKISFVPDVTLRDLVNRPFAQFETVAINDGVDFSALDKKSNAPINPTNEEEDEAPETNSLLSESELIQDVPDEVVPSESQDSVKNKQVQLPEPHVDEIEVASTSTLETEKTDLTDVPESIAQCENVTVLKCDENTLENDSLQKQNDNLSGANELLREQLKRAYRIIYTLVIGIFLCLLFIMAGFFYAFTKVSTTSKNIVGQQIQAQAPAKVSVIKKDTTKTSIKEKESNDSISSKKANLATKDNTVSLYDSDVRVRTGAYRIIGVKTTVKVRAGQTLSSISNFFLGPGMECYVEAINGINEVKEGQVIKIPELKHKHAKK